MSEKRPGVDVLLAVFEGVREEDVEEVERLLKGVLYSSSETSPLKAG